jgi:hypothetical protein
MSQSPDSEPSRGMLSFPVLLAVAGITSVATAGIFLVGGSSEEASHQSAEVAVAADPGKKAATASSVSDDPDETTPAGRIDKPKVSTEDAEAARTTRLLIGSWTRESYGTRTLTIHEDGTAKMVIKPSSVYSFVFGSVINVEVKWELQDGHVDYKVTGGTPTDKVDLAKKTWGDHWHEKINKLNEKTLILQGEEGDKYEWTRVETPKPASDET